MTQITQENKEQQPVAPVVTESDTNPEMSVEATDKNLMEELLDKHFPQKQLRRNDVVDGKLISKSPEELIVNIGYKSEGIVPAKEMRSLETGEGIDNLQVGDNLVVYIINPEDSAGRPVLSIDRARGEQGWRILENAMETQETMNGIITGSNRGGAVVDAEGVHGFIPVSQLVGPARELYVPGGEPPKEGFVGMEIQFKVLELNRRRNRAIFSERSAIQAWKKIQKSKLVHELQEGEIREGTVVGISNFGAFVDLGGADGLIHISEMSWDSIKSPADILSMGQKINVYILKVDIENLKIALSLRRLQPEPWEDIENKFYTGDIVKCKITKVTSFGAFARLGQGIEGLIHISELSHKMIKHPKEVVSEDEEVYLKIIRIEPERRRLALSLKQLEDKRSMDEYRAKADETTKNKKIADAESHIDATKSQSGTEEKGSTQTQTTAQSNGKNLLSKQKILKVKLLSQRGKLLQRQQTTAQSNGKNLLSKQKILRVKLLSQRGKLLQRQQTTAQSNGKNLLSKQKILRVKLLSQRGKLLQRQQTTAQSNGKNLLSKQKILRVKLLSQREKLLYRQQMTVQSNGKNLLSKQKILRVKLLSQREKLLYRQQMTVQLNIKMLLVKISPQINRTETQTKQEQFDTLLNKASIRL